MVNNIRMTESSPQKTEQENESLSSASSSSTPPSETEGPVQNRIIKRLGGRHLIFRTRSGKGSLLPRAYALISNFRGPMWFFYGLGQVWLTHKKYKEYDGWLARVPRVWSPKITSLLDRLETAITRFTHYCNENGIEGTIVLEPSLIEFHWTFGYPLAVEKEKKEHSNLVEGEFQKLVDAFLVARKELDL